MGEKGRINSWFGSSRISSFASSSWYRANAILRCEPTVLKMLNVWTTVNCIISSTIFGWIDRHSRGMRERLEAAQTIRKVFKGNRGTLGKRESVRWWRRWEMAKEWNGSQRFRAILYSHKHMPVYEKNMGTFHLPTIKHEIIRYFVVS